MSLFDKDFKEIFSSELVSIIIGLFAGILLAIYTKKILLIPGMLILLPAFLEMRGSLDGSLSSRISSGLFLGVVKPKKYNTPIIKGNEKASILLALGLSLLLGFIVFLINYFIFGIVYVNIIFLPLLAAIFSSLIEIPLIIAITFYLFRKGHDPNNIMGPFLTSTGDVASILGLLIGVLLI